MFTALGSSFSQCSFATPANVVGAGKPAATFRLSSVLVHSKGPRESLYPAILRAFIVISSCCTLVGGSTESLCVQKCLRTNVGQVSPRYHMFFVRFLPYGNVSGNQSEPLPGEPETIITSSLQFGRMESQQFWQLIVNEW